MRPFRYKCKSCGQTVIGELPKWDPNTKSWIRIRTIKCPHCGSEKLEEVSNQ